MKKATAKQQYLAKQGIGRITKNGVYQSPAEVARRERNEIKRQVSREIARLQKSTIGGDVLNRRIANLTEQYNILKNERLQTGVSKDSMRKKKNETYTQRMERLKKIETYRMQRQRAFQTAKEVLGITKNVNIHDIEQDKSKYSGFESRIWQKIYTYTYGVGKSGIWGSGKRSVDKFKRISEYVSRETGVALSNDMGNLTKDERDFIFKYFEDAMSRQYGGYDFISDILAPPEEDKRYRNNIELGYSRYIRS